MPAYWLALLPSCSDQEAVVPAPPTVNTVTIADVSNFGDGRDLEVTLGSLSDPSSVTELRIIVVKSANATAMTLAAAESLTSFYTATTPETNKKMTLSQDAKDSDGSTITEDQAYVVVVLTVGKGGTNALSKPSNGLTLTLQETPTSSAPHIDDVSNFGDGRDILVSFSKVNDETLITGYRIIVVKAVSAATFTLTEADALTTDRYTGVTKSGADVSVTLSMTTLDSDGNLIVQDGQYRAFILTLGADRNTGVNKLSAASNALTVEIPTAPAITGLSVVDVANNANAKDIEVKFSRVLNEDMIASYRAIIVKATAAPSMDLAVAESLPLGRYVTILKTGNNIAQELTAGVLDSDGDAIQESVAYVVRVLSVADGVVAGKNSLSPGSANITLMQKNAVRTFASFPSSGTGGMEVDASGNVYFGDFGLSETSPGTLVYKITPGGATSVFVGGMMAADGNDFDSQGNFYSVSWTANQIIKVTPSGTRSVFAAGGVVNGPIGIAIDASDNLFVTCYNNNTVLKIASNGAASLFSTSGLYNGPNGIDIDAAGNIYVSNYNDGSVIKVNKDNGSATLFASTVGQNAHLVIKNDIIYVAGRSSHKIYKVTLAGVVSDFLGTGVVGNQNGPIETASINSPNDIAFNATGTKMYISVKSPTVVANQFGPAFVKEVSIVE